MARIPTTRAWENQRPRKSHNKTASISIARALSSNIIISPSIAFIPSFSLTHTYTHTHTHTHSFSFSFSFHSNCSDAGSRAHPTDVVLKKNTRLILKYLIPVKLLVGSVPNPALLHVSGLAGVYADVIGAVRSGSVRTFERALQTHMLSYVSTGTYLLLEKLRLAVYRRLLKKVQRVHALQAEARGEGQRASQVPLALFARALSWQGVGGEGRGGKGEGEGGEVDGDEVEAIVANLIYRGYAKGYIAHKKHVLVLSKLDPFPKLNSAMLKDPE